MKNITTSFVDLANESLKQMGTPATKKSLTKQIATREASIDFMSLLMGTLPNPDPVLDGLGTTIEVFESLTYDSRVSACIQSRKSAVQSMEWEIVGEDTPQEQVDFHKSYFGNYKLENIMVEILDAALYGYKPIEIVWEVVENKMVPVEFVGKPSRWFTYGEQNELRFLTMTDMGKGIEVPPYKFIVARHNPTYDNPFGQAILSPCYWPVTFRKNGLKLFSIFLEKYGSPFLLGKAPDGTRAEAMQEVADMLDYMVQDAIAVVPSAYEVEILESKGVGSTDNPLHKIYIDVMNTEIAMAILGTNLTTEVQGGSYAASKSHMEVREDIIESDARIVMGAFDELIKMVHEINFGLTPHPRFKLFAEEKVDIERSTRDVNLIACFRESGVQFTRDYFKKKYNLTDKDVVDVKVGDATKKDGEDDARSN